MSKKAQLTEIGKGLGLKIANNAKEETIAKKVAEKKGVSVEELYASLGTDPVETATQTPAVITTTETITEKPKNEQPAVKPKADDRGLSGKKLKVIVHNNDPLSKDREFFIGHNGNPFKGEYEKEINLEIELIKVLKDAFTEVEEAIFDGQGQPTGKTRVVEKKRFLIESVIEDL